MQLRYFTHIYLCVPLHFTSKTPRNYFEIIHYGLIKRQRPNWNKFMNILFDGVLLIIFLIRLYDSYLSSANQMIFHNNTYRVNLIILSVNGLITHIKLCINANACFMSFLSKCCWQLSLLCCRQSC